MSQVLSVIETERLNLREVTLDDAGFILRLVNDPDWLRFIGERGVRTTEAAQGYILSSFVEMYGRLGFGLWLVERKEGRVPMGICGLLKRDVLEDVDLGFAFLPEFRGNGYAREAAAASVSYGENTLHLERIIAIATSENAQSRRLLEKLGFHYERTRQLSENAPEVMLYAIDL